MIHSLLQRCNHALLLAHDLGSLGLHPLASSPVLLLGEISAELWTHILGASVTVLTTFAGVIALWIKSREAIRLAQITLTTSLKTATRTKHTATSVEEVKATANTIHGLVNGGTGIALRDLATARRRLANMTKDPKDIAAAETAELASRNHDAALEVSYSGTMAALREQKP